MPSATARKNGSAVQINLTKVEVTNVCDRPDGYADAEVNLSVKQAQELLGALKGVLVPKKRRAPIRQVRLRFGGTT